MGISGKMTTCARAGARRSNRAKRAAELQADCFAGVRVPIYAQNAWQILGRMEEARTRPAKIGDDALQRGSGGARGAESFTHGTSAQRQALVCHRAQNRLGQAPATRSRLAP